MTRSRSMIFVLVLGLAWAILDQLAKYLVVGHLTALFPADAGLLHRIGLFYGTDGLYHLARPPAQILAPVWDNLYVQNPAGAFGLLTSAPLAVRRAILSAVALIASVGILWMARRAAGEGRLLTRIALGLVLGGALGNLTDRIVHGYVIDFIDWHLAGYHWPAFNVADVGIVVGVFSLLFLLNRRPAESDDAEEADASSPEDAAPAGSHRSEA